MTTRVEYLLDANVISEMMRPAPTAQVAIYLDSIAERGLAIASITVWEILNGIGRLDSGQRRSQLARLFHDLIELYFEDRVFDWSLSDAECCARIMEEKRRRGEPLDDHLPDAMLAGLAVNHNLTLVTRNESVFRNTGAKFVNPWQLG